MPPECVCSHTHTRWEDGLFINTRLSINIYLPGFSVQRLRNRKERKKGKEREKAQLTMTQSKGSCTNSIFWLPTQFNPLVETFNETTSGILALASRGYRSACASSFSENAFCILSLTPTFPCPTNAIILPAARPSSFRGNILRPVSFTPIHAGFTRCVVFL